MLALPGAWEAAKSSSNQSPKHSPRGTLHLSPRQHPHQPCGSEPQAGPLPPAPSAVNQQAQPASAQQRSQQSPAAAGQSDDHLSSAQLREPSHQLPASASHESESQFHAVSIAHAPHQRASSHDSAESVSCEQQRADSGQSAQPHHKAHSALSVKTKSQLPAGPPNQDLLAGLGSALRAQARLRRKAVAPETASPDERDSILTHRLGEVAPSGRLSFDDAEQKTKGAKTQCGIQCAAHLHSAHNAIIHYKSNTNWR